MINYSNHDNDDRWSKPTYPDDDDDEIHATFDDEFVHQGIEYIDSSLLHAIKSLAEAQFPVLLLTMSAF